MQRPDVGALPRTWESLVIVESLCTGCLLVFVHSGLVSSLHMSSLKRV